MKKTYIIMSFTVLIFLSFISVSNTDVSKKAQKVTILKDKTSDGVPIEVEIFTMKYTKDMPYNYGSSWGADEYVPPKRIITDLNIKYGGKEVFVPLSVYSDLTSSRKYSIQTIKNGFYLIIVGGDAGVSYKAEIIAGVRNVKKRTVRHGEFPDESWEETVYSIVPDDGR